jgi:hypothetical protein
MGCSNETRGKTGGSAEGLVIPGVTRVNAEIGVPRILWIQARSLANGQINSQTNGHTVTQNVSKMGLILDSIS